MQTRLEGFLQGFFGDLAGSIIVLMVPVVYNIFPLWVLILVGTLLSCVLVGLICR